jgi:hypothetical protein
MKPRDSEIFVRRRASWAGSRFDDPLGNRACVIEIMAVGWPPAIFPTFQLVVGPKSACDYAPETSKTAPVIARCSELCGGCCDGEGVGIWK